ncbi:hypothetical protein JCM21900_003197 [Sporobolomyces salmonicolor]
MAKGSGRFRNRKLGFKTRINVEVGVVIDEDPLDADLDVEDDKAHKGVETGVDKDEEGEVHLQAVIASTAAYVAKNTAAGSSSSSVDKGKRPTSAYIPTRSTTTIPDAEFRALYKPGYVDPVSYIRFSDTVEDTTVGAVAYTMDEDDEDWLEDFNAQFEEGGAAGTRDKGNGPADTAAGDEAETPSGRGARVKGKAAAAAAGGAEVSIAGTEGLADQPSPTEPLSEDDFERIMETFELITDEKAPMAHVDTSVLPVLADFEDAFDDILRPRLRALRPYAKIVYPHWRERRVQRHGKRIIPQLDYDESNEQNPYVCFRRRELKTSRKTRRSDQQNLERLIRLRNDLYAAHALMVKVAERERLKLEAIEVERQVFDRRCEMRELKRRLNEPDGDEELLISRREKKRKREDGSVGSLRLSIRKPDPSNVSPASLVPPMEEHTARKARNEALMKQIERDLQRKRQNDQHWDDWSDSSYLARPPPTPARFWRTVEPTPNSIPFSTGKREALGFATQWQPPIGRVRSSFRKRVGRGGRILLDRIAPARRGDDEPPLLSSKRRLLPAESDASDAEEEDEWLTARRRERLRYDTDVGLDFPAADEPALLDDFELRHLLRRVSLLKPTDVEALSIDSAYLDEAFRHAASDPDKHHPPPQVVGRPPPRPLLQVQPTGQPLSGQGGVPPNPAAYAQAQSAIAAQQALRAAQQQQAAAQAVAVQRQRQQQAAVAASQAAAAAAAAGGSPSDQMRRTPSQQGSPVGQAQAQLPLPMQQNGQGGLVLSAGFPNHAHLSPQSPQSILPQQQQQQQRLSPLPPNGANGLPATSRLSGPPFSNPQALQLAIQQQQQQQALAAQQAAHVMAMSQAQAARPLSSNGPPSRPSSAASHHSPGMQAPPLPAGSAGMRAAPGTPPAQQAQKRASPMSYQLQAGPGGGQPLQMKQAQAQGYGGFVQG